MRVSSTTLFNRENSKLNTSKLEQSQPLRTTRPADFVSVYDKNTTSISFAGFLGFGKPKQTPEEKELVKFRKEQGKVFEDLIAKSGKEIAYEHQLRELKEIITPENYPVANAFLRHELKEGSNRSLHLHDVVNAVRSFDETPDELKDARKMAMSSLLEMKGHAGARFTMDDVRVLSELIVDPNHGSIVKNMLAQKTSDGYYLYGWESSRVIKNGFRALEKSPEKVDFFKQIIEAKNADGSFRFGADYCHGCHEGYIHDLIKAYSPEKQAAIDAVLPLKTTVVSTSSKRLANVIENAKSDELKDLSTTVVKREEVPVFNKNLRDITDLLNTYTPEKQPVVELMAKQTYVNKYGVEVKRFTQGCYSEILGAFDIAKLSTKGKVKAFEFLEKAIGLSDKNCKPLLATGEIAQSLSKYIRGCAQMLRHLA